MYIARRTGGGRGVYEIAGATTTGLTSDDLLDHEIVFEFSPDLRLPSGVVLHVQGGKHRLYMANAEIQIQRQLAAALMLPSPRRANDGLGDSIQVPRTKQYVVERIQLEFVDSIAADKAYVVPDRIDLQNSAVQQTIPVQDRLAAIRETWANASRLPEPLRILVAAHETFVTSGIPITAECEQLVSTIQKVTSATWPGETDALGDPLEVLVSHLDLDVTPLSLPGDHGMSAALFALEGEFDLPTAAGIPERVRRDIINRRGQRSFRQALLTAYDKKCQVTDYDGEPALEAAHIYPYSEGGEYTNDPRNGLLLRADIHVLFDLGLVRVAPDTLTMRVMDKLAGSSYASLDGRTLRTGTALKPSTEALAKKWAQAS